MLPLLEFPSEGKSLHNGTEETLKGEITGRRRGCECVYILAVHECVGTCARVFCRGNGGRIQLSPRKLCGFSVSMCERASKREKLFVKTSVALEGSEKTD